MVRAGNRAYMCICKQTGARDYLHVPYLTLPYLIISPFLAETNLHIYILQPKHPNRRGIRVSALIRNVELG